jgi:hypothetical protein
MSLKHNPFDNSFKGTLVRRKKVFETPTPQEVGISPALPSVEFIENNRTQQNLTEQNKTELNTTKQDIALNKTEQVAEQNRTRIQIATEQNQTQLNSTLNKRLNTTEQNKTKQELPSDEVEQKLFGLTGNRKKVVFAVYDLALENGDDEVDLTYDLWSDIAHIKKESIKTTVRQLKLDGYLEVSAPKGGRGAIIRVLLQKDFLLIYSKLNNKLNKKLNNTLNKSASPSSSILNSSNSLNTTTTEEPVWLNIPEKLKGQIPINQLRSLLKAGTIDQETLEDSLWGFAHDLEKNLVKSKTGNTIGLFFGAVRNGGYISQQYLSQKQAELQEVQARVGELKKLREELETNQLAEEFEAFKKDFPEKAEAMKPSNTYIKSFEKGGIGYRMWVDEFKTQRTKASIS